MADTQKYLDYAGLVAYDNKLKAKIDEQYAKKSEVADVDLSDYLTLDKTFNVMYRVDNGPGVGFDGNITNHLLHVFKNSQNFYDSITELRDDVSDILDAYPTKDEADDTYAKKSEVVDQDTLKQIIAEAQHIKKEVVDSLPTEAEGVENVIYLVKKTGKKNNGYDEYLLINGAWELIGDTATEVDLSDYATKNEVTNAIESASPHVESISVAEIDALFA